MRRKDMYVYGDNVDTDVIIPARYLNAPDEKSLASHCMEDIDADFAATVEPGDIIVGGANFGCGSSREHAPLAIKACGVKCVIAASFARIFYRNAINIGFPIMECPEAAAGHQGRRPDRRGLCYRQDRQPDHRQDLSGGALPGIHQRHHRQRRSDGLSEGTRHCKVRKEDRV